MTQPPQPPPATPSGPFQPGGPAQPGGPFQPGGPSQPGYGNVPGAPPPAGYAVPPGPYGQPGYGQPGYGQAPQYGYQVVPRPKPTAPDGRPLAEFGDRLLAVLIDGAVFLGFALVLGIPLAIGFIAIIGNATNQAQIDANGNIVGQFGFATVFLPLIGLYLAFFLLTIAFTYVYEVEMMYKRGATWGKRAMKLRIVPLADPGAPLTRGMAAKRWLINYVVGAFVPFFRWIDGLWQLWDQPYRQCLHDKWAGTVVVKVSE